MTARRRPPRRLAALAVAALLAACGPLPQPFRHDDGAVADLARPKLERGLTLRLGTDLPQAEALTEQLQRSFDLLEIPLALPGSPAGGRVLAVAAQDGALVWRLLAPDGKEIAQLSRPAPATAAAAARQASEIATAISASFDDPDAQGSHPSATRPRIRPRVRVEPLRGLPGNGDQALTAALVTALSRRGVDVVQDGPITVVGQITITPAPADTGPDREILQVSWLVKAGSAGGRQLARLDQAGPVPKGRLGQPWGALAGDIAEGGALDLTKVLRLAAEALADGDQPPPPQVPRGLALPPTLAAPPPQATPPEPPQPPATTPAGPKPFTQTGAADIGKPVSNDPAISTTPGPSAASVPPPPPVRKGAKPATRAKASAAKAKVMTQSQSLSKSAAKAKPPADQDLRPQSVPPVTDTADPVSRSHPDR